MELYAGYFIVDSATAFTCTPWATFWLVTFLMLLSALDLPDLVSVLSQDTYISFELDVNVISDSSDSF